LAEPNRNSQFFRMDATYYSPLVASLRSQICRCREWKRLKEVCSDIILIPKTFVPGVYKVEKEYGTPYLTGKELFLARPVADTFITSSKPELIERLLVHRGTTLVTCGGTVGKAMYVWGPLEGAAVIHHAIRVIPNGTLHPGYVYAWLASDAGWAQM